ncbi:hypothetical protein HF996_03531 [Mycoplasma sp. 1654_15]|nr:hypothetical protein HF996_03531 [Mycoplasma sp. 1654_15]
MYYRNLKVLQSNFLEDENNCIESSTAIGFIIKEFLTRKLKLI